MPASKGARHPGGGIAKKPQNIKREDSAGRAAAARQIRLPVRPKLETVAGLVPDKSVPAKPRP
jgi:hypothetical protein